MFLCRNYSGPDGGRGEVAWGSPSVQRREIVIFNSVVELFGLCLCFFHMCGKRTVNRAAKIGGANARKTSMCSI